MTKKIKVTDKTTLELATYMVGFRGIINSLAFQYGETTHRFWERLREIYELPPDKYCTYNHTTNEIEIME